MDVETIKDIVMAFAGDYPDNETRSKIGRVISEGVFKSHAVVTDVATPEEVDQLKLVYAVEIGGKQSLLTISSANGMLNKENIQVTLQ